MLLNGDIGKLSDEQRESVQGIEDSNARLAQIVDSMLIVSYMDLGKFEVRAEPADLPDLARKLLAAELQRFPGKQLEVKESFQDVPNIYLDMRVIRIILENIFSNAVKYTPSGGKITVNIWPDDKKLHAGSRGSVLVEVADTGYGIPRYQQENVFTKMFRASNAKAKDTDGTGLGLFIVKSLLDRVGGRVSFESEEGKGTTMSILLPIEGMTDMDSGAKGKAGHA
jgi:signal transduction histidine kinase